MDPIRSGIAAVTLAACGSTSAPFDEPSGSKGSHRAPVASAAGSVATPLGSGTTGASALVTDNDRNVFVGGTRWDSADADLYTKDDARHRPFVARLAPSGEITWVRELGGNGSARISHLVAFSDDRLAVTETEPSLGRNASPTKRATFVARLGANGEREGERMRSDVDCLVAGEADALLVVSRGGITQIDDAPRLLLELDKEQVL